MKRITHNTENDDNKLFKKTSSEIIFMDEDEDVAVKLIDLEVLKDPEMLFVRPGWLAYFLEQTIKNYKRPYSILLWLHLKRLSILNKSNGTLKEQDEKKSQNVNMELCITEASLNFSVLNLKELHEIVFYLVKTRISDYIYQILERIRLGLISEKDVIQYISHPQDVKHLFLKIATQYEKKVKSEEDLKFLWLLNKTLEKYLSLMDVPVNYFEFKHDHSEVKCYFKNNAYIKMHKGTGIRHICFADTMNGITLNELNQTDKDILIKEYFIYLQSQNSSNQQLTLSDEDKQDIPESNLLSNNVIYVSVQSNNRTESNCSIKDISDSSIQSCRTKTKLNNLVEEYYKDCQRNLSIYINYEKQLMNMISVSTNSHISQCFSSNRSAEDSFAANLKISAAIYEFYHTEINYVKNLIILRDVYLKFLLDRKIISVREASFLFPRLSEITTFHENFLKKVPWQNEEYLFSLIVDNIRNMFGVEQGKYAIKIYSAFCSLNRIGLAHIKKRKSSKMKQAFETFKNFKECKRLNYYDLNINVYQRMSRYPLLVSNILKFMVPDDPKYPLLCEANELSTNVVSTLNSQLEEIELYIKLTKICHRIINFPESDKKLILCYPPQHIFNAQYVEWTAKMGAVVVCYEKIACVLLNCGKHLMPIMKDKLFLPYKNLTVWNDSIAGTFDVFFVLNNKQKYDRKTIRRLIIKNEDDAKKFLDIIKNHTSFQVSQENEDSTNTSGLDLEDKSGVNPKKWEADIEFIFNSIMEGYPEKTKRITFSTSSE